MQPEDACYTENWMMSIVSSDDGRSLEPCELLRVTAEWALERLAAGESTQTVTARLQQRVRDHPCSGLVQNFSRFFQKIPANAARVRAWLDMCQKHETSAAAIAAPYLEKFDSMLVCPGNDLVRQALFAMTRTATIFVAGSSPQGVRLAEQLTDSLHRVYLIHEMAAFSVLDRADCLLSGCSAVTPRGLVQPIGTAAVCTAARAAGKKVYFFATSDMKLDDWEDENLLCQGPASEIYPGRNEKLHVENYRFELMPTERADGIFLETGMTSNVFA